MVTFDRKEFNYWLKLYGYKLQDIVDILEFDYGIKTSYAGFNNLLRGNYNFSLEKAMAIADIFEIEVQQLFKLKKVK